jgi:hypothetical protein
MQISVATLENSVENPKKLKLELPHDLAMPLLSMYLKEQESG